MSATEVESVQPGSPAAKAGIHGGAPASSEGSEVVVGGDIITSFAGKSITGAQSLGEAVSSKRPGSVVTVGVLRPNGQGGYAKKNIAVTLGSRPTTNPFESSKSSEG